MSCLVAASWLRNIKIWANFFVTEILFLNGWPQTAPLNQYLKDMMAKTSYSEFFGSNASMYDLYMHNPHKDIVRPSLELNWEGTKKSGSRVIFQHWGDNRRGVTRLWGNQRWRETKDKIFCLIFHNLQGLQYQMTYYKDMLLLNGVCQWYLLVFSLEYNDWCLLWANGKLSCSNFWIHNAKHE